MESSAERLLREEDQVHVTGRAKGLWERLSTDRRSQLISAAWCGSCAAIVAMAKVSGAVIEGNLVLRGECRRCAARIVHFLERA